jgi:tetratricopeptide (TPR) repeat protein
MSREFRVFVSSTFSDMIAEREELVRRVFPALRERCAARGVAWCEVDLRWGLTDEDKALGRVVPVCLEAARAADAVLVLLGDYYGWTPGPGDLPADFADAFPEIGRYPGASVTEMELRYGLLDRTPASHAVVCRRRPDAHPPGARRDDNPPRAARLHADLAACAAARGHPYHQFNTPAELATLVRADFERLIDRLFPPDDPHTAADRGQAAAAARYEAGHVERAPLLAALDRWCRRGGRPLLLTGPAGAGKTALLCRWAGGARGAAPVARWRRAFGLVRGPGLPADALVLLHLPDADGWPGLVARTREAVRAARGLALADTPTAAAAAASLPAALAGAGPLVWAVDGLDELDPDGDLGWLPDRLPPGVRLVATAAPGPAADRWAARGWDVLAVPPLAPPERRLVAERHLARFGKRLGPAYLDAVLAAGPCDRPLPLRVLLDELRAATPRYEELRERVATYAASADPAELLDRVLARCAADFGRDRPGAVDDGLRLVLAARDGLADPDLLALLGPAPDPRRDWEGFRQAVPDLFARRGDRLVVAHPLWRAAGERRCLATPAARRAAARALADHFARAGWSPHATREVPWQLARLGAWAELAAVVTSAGYLTAAWPADPGDVRAHFATAADRAPDAVIAGCRPLVARPEDAPVAAEAAAHLLADHGATDAALDLVTRLAPALADPAARGRVLGLRATLLFRAGRPAEAAAALAERERDARAAGDAATLAAVLTERAARGGGPEAARRAWLDEAEAVCRRAADVVGLSEVHGTRARLLIGAGRGRDALAELARQEAACRVTGHAVGLHRCLGDRAYVLGGQGRAAEALAAHAEEEGICRRLGDFRGACASLGNQVRLLREAADFDAAVERLEEWERVARAHAGPAELADVLLRKADVYGVGLGQAGLAAGYLRAAAELAVCHDLPDVPRRVAELTDYIARRPH